jgi:hypothetical protein
MLHAEEEAMIARRLVGGLSVAWALFGVVVSGCGTSSNSASDAGSDSSDDFTATLCSPAAVRPSDAGACNECIFSMCGTQLTACNKDCTCGMTINGLNECIAMVPPPSMDAAAAGGGLGALTGFLGAAGLGVVTCLAPFLMGGGNVGAGGTGDGAAGMAMSSATSNLFSCTLTSCATQCFGGMPEGGPDAPIEGGPVAEGGLPEASTSDSPAEGAPSPEPAQEAGPDASPDGPGDDGSSAQDAGEGG